MANETVSRRYALAIFSLAQESKKIDAVGRDLHALLAALTGDDSIARYFYAPIVERGEKGATLGNAFAGKVDDIALHTMLLLVRKRRERLFPEIVHQYDLLERSGRGAEPLTITSARELSSNELAQMVARLSKIYGKTFDVQQRVDPALLGGVRLRMGDTAIDGTVAGRLEELSRTLFSPQ